MKKVPPMAPISAKGPLGICQLPRLWSKVLLDTENLLPEGYSVCGQGFDRVVLEGLGLERQEVLAYLQSERPTYPDFERWVLKKLGGRLPDGAAEAINQKILGYAPPAEKLGERLRQLGVDDDGSITTTAEINQIDDWNEFHHYLVGGDAS